MFGDVSTMRLKKDSFIVVNQFNSGFGGKKIEIIISNKLKITKIDYYMSYDVVISGEEITYSVEKPSVELNINPFKKGLKQLKGKYIFTVVEKTLNENKFPIRTSTYQFQANFKYFK